MTPRERLAWIIAAVAVVAAGVVIVVVLINQDGNPPAAPAPPAPPCSDEITVYVHTDAEMQQIADTLRGDNRIGRLTTETKAEAFERFKETFKGQPELVKLARVEAIPATVKVLPAGGITSRDLADQLRTAYPSAQGVQNFPC
jgi:cell division protein FtsX